MATVSRSVSLSVSNDASSKNAYDDVFSAPAPARRGASPFSSRVDDYREIFPPSAASLGSSIPILDLPPLDRPPSSGVDYAGVFGGFRDDDGIAVPSEQMFADMKTKAQREDRLPRSRVQTRRLPSKSQEFTHGHGNDKISAPAQTKMQYSKSQEFPRNIMNNQTLTSPLDTGTPYLKSDNFPGDFPKVQIPATELSQQTVDNVKRFNVSYHKAGQLSKDGANGMTHIAHLHAVPGYTHVIDEVGPTRKAAFDKAKTMSMGDADFSSKVGEVSKPGKHTRAASDLGANDREANRKMQSCSTSVSNSPQSFGSDYLKRSSSQRAKRLGSNRESRTKVGFSTPLLDEELDENSAAALSSAAMKKAIKEAEEKIQWAKEFLKQLEGNGFIKPTLKDSFRVKDAGGMKHSGEIRGPKENVNLKVKASRKKKCINEEKVLKSNGCLNNRPSEGTNHANGVAAETGVTWEKSERQKDAMDVKATSEGQLENEVDVLKHRCHGVAAQVDTKMEKSCSFGSPAPETLKTPESVHQRDYANYKTNAHEDLKPEKVYKDEGGEWEAAKHLTQLISGVKSRLVSFISKQADTERRNVQEAPKKSESLEHSKKRVCLVRNTGTENHRGVDQENHEKLVKMNCCTPAVPGVGVQDSSRTTIGVESYEAEQKEVKMYDATSLDAKTCTDQPCGPSEPIEGLGKIEAEELADKLDFLKQEDPTSEFEAECFQEVQEQTQESLNGTVRAEYGRSEMANTGLGKHADMPKTTCQSRQFDGIGTNGENDDATVEDVRSQEPVENGIDNDSLGGGRVDCGQLAGDGWEETKMSNSAEKKHPEDIRTVEETSMIDKVGQGVIEAEEMHDIEDTEKIASQNSMSGATEGHIDVVDEDSEHDEYVAEVSDICKQDQLLAETTEASTLDEVYELVRTERMAGSATVAFEPEDLSVQESKQLIREGMCEQMLRSVEVDEGSKHDECFLAVGGGMHVQDVLSSSSRDEESSAQCALDVDLPSENGNLAEPAFKIETPGSMWMGDENSGKSGPPVETTDDDILESPRSLAADDVGHYVSMKNEPPFSGRNAESYGLDYINQCPEPEWKFSFEAKIMTTVGRTSEPGGNDEQLGSVETTGEQMLEASMSGGDRLDSDKNEMEIARADETRPGTNAQITENEIVLDTEQEHSDDAENVATDVAPVNEDIEAELSNDKATEQDASSCNGESPYTRKRWFRGGVEMGELGLKDQLNSEGTKIEDRVGTQVNEMVGESGVGVRMPQADGASGQDQESGQSNESIHRRRRWFESRGEVLHKPIPFDGVAATEEMDSKEKEKEAESKASKEAAHRRRRWFENGEKSGSPQRPSILEENEATMQPKEQKETVIDTTKLNEQLHEKSSTEDLGQSLHREKERERAAVERAIREARQRAFVEARDRAAAEARLKSTTAAQERQGKTAVSDKASMDAKIRVERAAVERATAEARERAMNKAMSDNAGFKNQSSGYSTSAVNESPQREKAISERNKRTTERAAKALQEKNMRDYLAQKEQAERNRYADVLDAEVKRWSTGKEGNLRSLLSTLQYILGPESGWQPTSLTDLVTTTAVRKAYKRAALCVHPDKLQQRRATVQQKYICEKVFDLLKDAWHRFNPDDR